MDMIKQRRKDNKKQKTLVAPYILNLRASQKAASLKHHHPRFEFYPPLSPKNPTRYY
jgi:hypothetical protein